MRKPLEWLVIGAGPAGIATVGLLMDAGVDPTSIAWVDPEFKAGDFGTAWRRIISNTPVESFTKFYQECQAFNFGSQPSPFFIEKMKPQETCPLMVAAQPLHWITENLCTQVLSIKDKVLNLSKQGNAWQATLASGTLLQTKKVVLAIGATHKSLNFPTLKEIPLRIALDPNALTKEITENDQVAVFGDAQSARSVLTHLSKLNPKKTFLFYRTENSFDRHLGSEDLNHVHAMEANAENFLKFIPQCQKAIYAIGFERRPINIEYLPKAFDYDRKTGIIAPGIFGIGIAFPEIRLHELGRPEYRVSAIRPFMKRLKKVLPVWLNQTIPSWTTEPKDSAEKVVEYAGENIIV